MSYVHLENSFISVKLDPSCGGRIVSLFDKEYNREFLWYDETRVPADPALDYDGNFAGGMDELLPCDLPERGFPDHGELWQTPLECSSAGNVLTVRGKLPLSQLFYKRTLSLEERVLRCFWEITNESTQTLDFLWKLHGALHIAPGDTLHAPAGVVQAADPGDWSKASDGLPRRWKDPYTVPQMDKSSDFFYLTDLERGELLLKKRSGGSVRCTFDLEIFPCAWIFASFGRLNNSRTLIFEPCTNYPLSIDDALKQRCCARLEGGQTLSTTVTWSIGE